MKVRGQSTAKVAPSALPKSARNSRTGRNASSRGIVLPPQRELLRIAIETPIVRIQELLPPYGRNSRSARPAIQNMPPLTIGYVIASKTRSKPGSPTESLFTLGILLITANASSISATAPGTSIEDLVGLEPALAVSGFTR